MSVVFVAARIRIIAILKSLGRSVRSLSHLRKVCTIVIVVKVVVVTPDEPF